MNNPCLKFQDNKVALSSKVQPSKNILLGHFDSLRQDHYVVLTHQEPVTHWCSMICQKNGLLG